MEPAVLESRPRVRKWNPQFWNRAHGCSGRSPHQELGAFGPGGELQRLLTGDARTVARLERRAVTEHALAERYEYVDVLVGRQIDSGSRRNPSAPQHGISLMKADSALVTFARGDGHQFAGGQCFVDVTLLVTRVDSRRIGLDSADRRANLYLQ